MALPASILDLENRYVGVNGEPTLGAAFSLARDAWSSGNRDRELRLHLLFLAWYCNLEPPGQTGYEGAALGPDRELSRLFVEVFGTFEDTVWDDPECLFVVGLIADISPWLLGETVALWDARSARFRKRYRELVPNGLPATVFDARGAYGEYFASQVAVVGGY